MRESIFDYVPTVLESKSASLVFANHGKKSGTMLSFNFRFLPADGFKPFFRTSETTLSAAPEQSEASALRMPITIEPGANNVFYAFPNILTIDWKRVTLATVLEPSLSVDEVIERAINKSKKKFESFGSFLKNAKVLGTISCDITYTKGRFSTKVVTRNLFSAAVTSQPELASPFFGEILQKWEDINPNRNNLLNEIAYPLENLLKENGENIHILRDEITEQNLNMSNPNGLRIDSWKQLCMRLDSYIEATHWFLIRSDEGLEPELKVLYQEIDRYRQLIEDLRIRKDFSTETTIKTSLIMINQKRMGLLNMAQTIESRLLQLHARVIK